MGRRTALKTKGITIDDIKKYYIQFGKVGPIARKTGISTRTIRTYLKTAGVELRRGRPKDEGGFHFSKLAKWIRANPKVPLPRKPGDISKLTSIPINDIKTYLFRRRKSVRDFVESLPDFKTKNYILVDTGGRRVPTRAFKFYILSIDKFTLDIRVRAVLNNGKRYIFKYTMNELKGVLNEKNN